MKQILGFIILVLMIIGCAEQGVEVDQLRESTYVIHRAGYDPVRGLVTFTELAPGKIQVEINLENTDDRYDFPAHLHFGTINEVGELAFKLHDVTGNTGVSSTILENVKLSSGEIFTYDLLQEMNGSVKIHLSDDLFKHVVLAYGNIGANENYLSDGVTVCTGH